MDRIIVNGKVTHFEIGHTLEEWEREYGSTDDSLWDFSLADVIEGAIETDYEMVYWYIDGRLYETDIEFDN